MIFYDDNFSVGATWGGLGLAAERSGARETVLLRERRLYLGFPINWMILN